MMFGGTRLLQQEMSRLSMAENEEDFQNAVYLLKNYLKEMEIGSECLLEVERRAYFLSNSYSEKDTKDKIEQAKKRIEEYINEVMNISLENKKLLGVLENFYLFIEGLLERKPHKKGGIQKEQLAA